MEKIAHSSHIISLKTVFIPQEIFLLLGSSPTVLLYCLLVTSETGMSMLSLIWTCLKCLFNPFRSWPLKHTNAHGITYSHTAPHTENLTASTQSRCLGVRSPCTSALWGNQSRRYSCNGTLLRQTQGAKLIISLKLYAESYLPAEKLGVRQDVL